MFRMLLVLLALLPARADDSHAKKETAAATTSAKETEEPVYELADGIKPPRIVHQVNPDYSGVRGVRVKGSIEIAMVITSQGVAKDLRVVQSLHPQVDRCAVEAVKQWRFAPAQKDGKPIAVRLTIELDFHSM